MDQKEKEIINLKKNRDEIQSKLEDRNKDLAAVNREKGSLESRMQDINLNNQAIGEQTQVYTTVI